MTRVVSLAALAAVLISAPARGMDPTPHTTAVTSVSIVPATGKAQVVIGVAGSVDVEDFTLEGPYRIVLDLSGATLGMAPKLYDRVSRGGIRNVRFAQYKKDVVRVVIDLDAAREYTIDRSSSDLRVSISTANARFDAWHGASTPQVAQAPERDTPRATPARRRVFNPPATSTQPRITVTYQDADIRDVLAAFAAFSGRTIVVGKGVEGKITAEVRDQPWDVAMNAILASQNLAAAEDNNAIITVDSYGNILAKESTEPLVTQLIPVNYTRAASLIETIGSLLSRACPIQPSNTTQNAIPILSCPPRGSVRADTATNTLLVTEVPSRIGDIVSYVHDLDVRTPQVAIKAKIILVDRTDIQDLGIQYDFGSSDAFFNKLVQRPSAFGPLDSDGDGINDSKAPTDYYPKESRVFRVGGNALAGIANANATVAQPALSLLFSTTLGKFSLTSFIDALQEVRLADVQAEPSIVTLDNKEARIVVGEETPIRVIDANSGGNGLVRATVSFKESGIILQVTPHITSNRQILMTLHSERSNIQTASSDLGYTFSKQLAENQLLVNDGETSVIGGLTVTQVSVSKTGIPLLVDLPLIGRLFGQTRTQEDKRDLLILVTPHIVDDGDRLGRAAEPR